MNKQEKILKRLARIEKELDANNTLYDLYTSQRRAKKERKRDYIDFIIYLMSLSLVAIIIIAVIRKWMKIKKELTMYKGMSIILFILISF